MEPQQLARSVLGNLVTFLSDAPNLVATDANGTTTDVFVRNRTTRQTLLVSRIQSGVQPNPGIATRYPVISGDGRGIAFSSDSGNLPGTADTNGFWDVFLACRGLRRRVHERTWGISVLYPRQ